MEPRFGHDFSDVRVHSSSIAQRSAEEINARAYTAGHNIVFGAGQFAPTMYEGQQLIAHELTHIVQQSGSNAAHSSKNENGFVLQRDLSSSASNQTNREDVAEAFVKAHFSYENFRNSPTDVYDKFAEDLYEYLYRHPQDFKFVHKVFDRINSEIEDNAAAAFVELLNNHRLSQFAATPDGRATLEKLYDALITGDVSKFQRKQANRILAAKKERTPEREVLKTEEQETLTFPVRKIGITRDCYAPLVAKLQPNGKINVYYASNRIWQCSMFKDEVKTIEDRYPWPAIMNGFEVDPEEVVLVKLYDEDGKIYPVPALQLIDFANQDAEAAISLGEKAALLGLTAGAGGLGGAGYLAWADRAVFFLSAISLVVDDHRDWIVKTFPKYGPAFLDALDVANRIAGYYGWARLGVDSARFVSAKVRPAWMNWRAEAEREALSGSDRALINEIDEQVKDLLDTVENGTKKTGTQSHLDQPTTRENITGSKDPAADSAVPSSQPHVPPSGQDIPAQELQAEIRELTQKAENQGNVKPLNDPKYDAEVTADGHVFKRDRVTKQWCRNSKIKCGISVGDELNSKVDGSLVEKRALPTKLEVVLASREESILVIGEDRIRGDSTTPGSVVAVEPRSPQPPVQQHGVLEPITPVSQASLQDLQASRSKLASDLKQTEYAIADTEELIEQRASGEAKTPTNEKLVNSPEERLKRLKNRRASLSNDLENLEGNIRAYKAKSTGELAVGDRPVNLRQTGIPSWEADAYIGTKTATYRHDVETLLNEDRQGPLSQKLLDKNGKIAPANVGNADYWKAHPEIFEAGHVRSARVGDKDVLILMSKSRNQAKFGATLERTGDVLLEDAYVIQGIAVDRGTAWELGFDEAFLSKQKIIRLAR